MGGGYTQNTSLSEKIYIQNLDPYCKFTHASP